MTTPNDRIEPHHADERMRCATCGTAWPCPPFLAARRAKPFGPLNIPVEEGRKVVAG